MQQIPHDFVDICAFIKTIKIDPVYARADNFTGQCVPGYESGKLLLTRQAALALQSVQEHLAVTGLALKVFDAYRPQRAVNYFLQWAKAGDDTRLKQQYYPRINKAELFMLGYLVEHSSHSRGSTVDLTLIDAHTGIELDMGTAFDFFDEQSRPDCLAVNQQQRANRMLLRSAMQQGGFIPLVAEWWHFTLQNEPYPETTFDFVSY